MVRDGVANLVIRLQECGFDPRRVGEDAWEARCPAHRGADDSLAITRDELNHPVLECRSTQKCPHSQIVRALGITNDHVYAETADWLIRRLSRVPIQQASFTSPGPNGDNEIGTSAAEGANESAGTLLPQQRDANGDATLASESSSPEAIYPAEAERTCIARPLTTISLIGYDNPSAAQVLISCPDRSVKCLPRFPRTRCNFARPSSLMS
jgi:hypothetical protein